MIWVALTALCLVAILVAEYVKKHQVVWVAKPLASLGFIGAALANNALDSAYGQAVLVALLLSWLGDLLLISRNSKLSFLLGIISFLLGHVVYIAAFVILGVHWDIAGYTLIPLALMAVLIGRWIMTKAPAELRPAVSAYIGVISIMVATSVGTSVGWIIPVAAISFYASDLAVALERFVKASFINQLWGLPLYYAAQLMFAYSL
ncbi:MAG: lysoplasmalogenase [Porticoccaceae bacterium]|nr:lysoplasmalogenase [Porticoccaceae bacterium]